MAMEDHPSFTGNTSTNLCVFHGYGRLLQGSFGECTVLRVVLSHDDYFPY